MSRGRWNYWQAGLAFTHIRKRTKQLCSILENRPRFRLPEKDTKEVEPDNSMIGLNKDPKLAIHVQVAGGALSPVPWTKLDKIMAGSTY